MFGFILLFGAVMFTAGADVQKSGDLDRIKKEIKEIEIKVPANVDSIINRG